MWVIFRKCKSFYYFLVSFAENYKVKKKRKHVKREIRMNDKKAERKRAERTSKWRKTKNNSNRFRERRQWVKISQYETEKDGRCRDIPPVALASGTDDSTKKDRRPLEPCNVETCCYALWPRHWTVCTCSTTYYTAFKSIFIQTCCKHCSSILLSSAWAGRTMCHESRPSNQAPTPRRFDFIALYLS